ncbi:MAG: 4'-phosphopantetheinyl transferase superfamily protein [Gemmatimonadota bacterium]
MSVGNDVVDLTAARATAMAAHPRFVERVFTETERERIRSSRDADLEVWFGWAAKEAAYKVASKLRGEPPVFVHRAFEVAWSTGLENSGGPRHGSVRYEGSVYPVRAEVAPDRGYVHALSFCTADAAPDAGPSLRPMLGADRPAPLPRGARYTVERVDRVGAPWVDTLDALRARLTQRERDAVHSLLSAAVRIGARADAADLLDIEADRLEIVCGPGRLGRRPPRVLVDGAPANIDVSLSHDGPWIAWAFTPPGTPVLAPTFDPGTKSS